MEEASVSSTVAETGGNGCDQVRTETDRQTVWPCMRYRAVTVCSNSGTLLPNELLTIQQTTASPTKQLRPISIWISSAPIILRGLSFPHGYC